MQLQGTDELCTSIYTKLVLYTAMDVAGLQTEAVIIKFSIICTPVWMHERLHRAPMHNLAASILSMAVNLTTTCSYIFA